MAVPIFSTLAEIKEFVTAQRDELMPNRKFDMMNGNGMLDTPEGIDYQMANFDGDQVLLVVLTISANPNAASPPLESDLRARMLQIAVDKASGQVTMPMPQDMASLRSKLFALYPKLKGGMAAMRPKDVQ